METPTRWEELCKDHKGEEGRERGGGQKGRQVERRIMPVNTGEVPSALHGLNHPLCPESVMPNKCAGQVEEEGKAPAGPRQRVANRNCKSLHTAEEDAAHQAWLGRT